jgi:hypothetical protein
VMGDSTWVMGGLWVMAPFRPLISNIAIEF